MLIFISAKQEFLQNNHKLTQQHSPWNENDTVLTMVRQMFLQSLQVLSPGLRDRDTLSISSQRAESR